MSLFIPADILLPKENFENWSVIACDQYTSRPDYWEETLKNTNGKPSALHLIYPEVYLECADREKRIAEINRKMNEYIEGGIYNEYKNAFIYIERAQADGRLRCGLVGALDLDAYDFNPNSDSAVRATEKTVVERIPPRVEIRKNAVTELPHVMMLADDPQKTVIEPLTEAKDRGEFQKLYDFELMQGGGHLAGWLVNAKYYEAIQNAISALGEGHDMTLAVGDGNHSLATAKVCHEKNPTELNRYALVELVNIHSEALDFEPIYRVVENVSPEVLISAFKDFLAEKGASLSDGDGQRITFAFENGETTVYVQEPPHSLAVGTVQIFLDEYMKSHGELVIDYIHGEDEIYSLAKKPNTVGVLYEGMKKAELFPAVEGFGTLPRKTFSMGHAYDKRYYTEVRKVLSK